MSFGTAYMTKKHNKKMCAGGKMAEGGEVKGVHAPYAAPIGGGKGQSKAGDETRWASATDKKTMPMSHKSHSEKAKGEHKRVLREQKSVPKPTSGMSGFAEGGEVEEMGEYDPTQDPMPKENEAANMEDADMIARIMHKRKEYSKGGMVANDTPPIADSMPADYDVLATSDELEDDSGAGNEHGDERVSDDPIDRLMMKRKKDKLPRPA